MGHQVNDIGSPNRQMKVEGGKPGGSGATVRQHGSRKGRSVRRVNRVLRTMCADRAKGSAFRFKVFEDAFDHQVGS
jgi:hypothetical protein